MKADQNPAAELVIDDFRSRNLTSRRGTQWRGVSDRVMGGVSDATVTPETIDGRDCLRLRGQVSLENDGGFIQAALDLNPDQGLLDAGGYAGIRLQVTGNSEPYAVHLRTIDCLRPWQSYRASFDTGPGWREVYLPFTHFRPHRLTATLAPGRLRRIGLVAIGRAFTADLGIAHLSLYPAGTQPGEPPT